jgi:hypothetical protein
MVKHTNETVTDIKLVDFQIIDYGSPIHDLAFFLFTSVQGPVLRYHFNKLLLFYYNEFIKTLQQSKVDLKEFSFESFEEELKLEMGAEICHSLVMLNVVFGPKGLPKIPGKAPEWNPNQQTNGNTSTPSHAGPPGGHAGPGAHGGPAGHKGPSGPGGHGGPGGPDKPASDEGPPVFPWPTACKEKLWFMVEEAAKRNWI